MRSSDGKHPPHGVKMKTMENIRAGLGLGFTPNTILTQECITTFNMTGTGLFGGLIITGYGNYIPTTPNILQLEQWYGTAQMT
jgi:hypothetical protein